LEVVRAYDILASKRTYGLAPNPISLSDIVAFFELYGRPVCTTMEVFIELLGVLDIKTLELLSGNKSPS
jgi:hypothetical protein